MRRNLKPMSQIRRFPSISLAIPASFVTDTPHLREKTFRIGMIGRAAAIFRVDEIIIFRDIPKVDQSADTDLINSILSYMETPQYLRKHLFSFRENLKYVGILPPLRTAHHPTLKHIRDLKLNEYREGVVMKVNKDGSYIDVGVEETAFIGGQNLPLGKRVTVKITSLSQSFPEASQARREEINIYWGYRVSVPNLTLGKIVKEELFDFTVLTSRRGKPFKEVIDEIKKKLKEANKVLVAFGSSNEGLREILSKEGIEMNEVADMVINTIPLQGTETVRTEEAIYATLASLNLIN
ncbi:MAG: methyltransferase [Thermoproteota archaeon]|nr:methyltransferase [Thermoproteota archaeon]